MVKEEIFEACENNKNLCKERIFANKFPEAYEDISNIYFPYGYTFQQKLYHWLNDMIEEPCCLTCGNKVKFINVILGYRKHCSNSCSRKDVNVQKKMYDTSIEKNGDYCNRKKSAETIKITYENNKNEIKEKTKKTKLEKYGNENYHNIEKAKKTNLKKYGSESPFGNSDIIEKSKMTLIERYGNEKYRNTKKMKNTNLEKYGVECPFSNEKIKEKIKETNIEKYGVENVFGSDVIKEKIKETNIEKYGVENVFSSDMIKEKIKETNIEKYGVVTPMQSDKIKEKVKETNIEKYGVEYPMQSDDIKKTRENNIYAKYGVYSVSQLDTTKEKINNTCLEKYNVLWPCQIPGVKQYSKDSKPNKMFANLLDESKIKYEREFPLEKYSYDFKIDDILVEINPTITHNSYFNIFGNEPKDYMYHYEKTNVALLNGYSCIHVWEWDDTLKIVNMLKNKKNLYARKLELKDVELNDCDMFLNNYHLQNSCKGQKIRIGLYNNGELVELMTFGKPRYNKNYEWELLRLCSHKDYKIVGGAERIFKYFIKQYNPESVISYCDKSKFSGSVYTKNGFTLHKCGKPSKHWYNIKTGQHITDNFLRQRGFDQIFNKTYGKGTSNEDLMINHGFLPVYDAGQMSFTWLCMQ